MPHMPSLPAASTGSPEPVAAEADYEALTDALMQTRRGRWFLAEHARRCREADHVDLYATLARIEAALAEPREPAGLAELHEKLAALPRIEQALGDYRDPPAMAELRESLTALARIEQTLAEPREPAGLAQMQEQLGALPRIEQALAEPRENSGIAELRDQVSAFAETLEGVRSEVAAQRPAERDEVEQARDREREEEMLRLLHEQRERLDALADIWARVQTGPAAPEPTAEESQATATSGAETAASLAVAADDAPRRMESQPGRVMETGGDHEPVPAQVLADRAERTDDQASMLPQAQTSTADLLNQTTIFGLAAEAQEEAGEACQAVTSTGSVGGSTNAPAPAAAKALPRTADAKPAQAFSDPPSSPTDRQAPAAADAAPQANADPIVQIFVDAEPPAAPADDKSGRSESAGPPDPFPSPQRAKLPAWLVGTAGGGAESAGYTGTGPAVDDSEALAFPAEEQAGPGAVIDEDEALFAADLMLIGSGDAATETTASLECDPSPEAVTADELFEPPAVKTRIEPQPASGLDPETELAGIRPTAGEPSAAAAEQVRAEMPGLAELTLDMLNKALFSNASRASEPAAAADPRDRDLRNSFTKALAESDLPAAIAVLRQALRQEDREDNEHDGVSEIVVLDDLPVHPPLPAALRAAEPAPPARETPRRPQPAAPSDPLAALDTLSDEERIALFS